MKNELSTRALFKDETRSIAMPLLLRYTYPWEALAHVSEYIEEVQKSLSRDEYDEVSDGVFIAKDATVAKTASISGPCIVMSGAEVRHCAFIRGSAIVGRGAVVGNSTELKNCILFDGVQVPHYNYVGDSILGYKSHMGAGAVTSNVKSDKTPVTVKIDGEKIQTERKKFGAILGDFVEIGCGSVLNPGTVIGRNTNVYPLSAPRGYVPENSIYKGDGNVVPKKN